MVGVAQWLEQLVVIRSFAGSSPVINPSPYSVVGVGRLGNFPHLQLNQIPLHTSSNFVVSRISVVYRCSVMDGPAFNQYIENLQRKRSSLRERLLSIEKELLEIESKLKMAEAVHEDYCREFELPLPPVLLDLTLQKKFAGLSIKEMLIIIAHESGGQLDIVEARTILLKAGVFQNERNAVTSMSPVLSRHDDIFKRTTRGNYTLSPAHLSEKELRLIGRGTEFNQRRLIHVDESGSKSVVIFSNREDQESSKEKRREVFSNQEDSEALKEKRREVLNKIQSDLATEVLSKLRHLEHATADHQIAIREELAAYPVEIRLAAANLFQIKYGRKAPE